MVYKRSYCVVFEQTKGDEKSIGKVQRDRLIELGEIPIVPFLTWKELNTIAYRWAIIFLKRFETILSLRSLV